MSFIDSNIFINWIKSSKKKMKDDIISQISGYILYRVENGETAYISNLVKEEVAIWISRYKQSKLSEFLDNLNSYNSLKIIDAIYTDKILTINNLGKIPLGYIDCVNLSIMNRLDIQKIYSTDKGFDKVDGIMRIFDELEKELESDVLSINGLLLFVIDDIIRNVVEEKHQRPQARQKLVVILTTHGVRRTI